MAAEKKKPTRRSVKNAKRISGAGSSGNVTASSADSAKMKETTGDLPTLPEIQVSDVGKKSNGQKAAAKETSSSQTKQPGEKSKASQKPTKKKLKNAEKEAKPKKSVKKKSAQPKTGMRWPQFIFLFFLLIFVVGVGLFGWDRWFRYDDVQDFQGQWTYVNGDSTVSVVIDEDNMNFADVAYTYEVDALAKSVKFSFSNNGGTGIYRFSLDRNTLVIAEGAQGDWFVDIKLALGLAEPTEGFEAGKTTVLTRTLDIADQESTTSSDEGSDGGEGPNTADPGTGDGGVGTDSLGTDESGNVDSGDGTSSDGAAGA